LDVSLVVSTTGILLVEELFGAWLGHRLICNSLVVFCTGLISVLLRLVWGLADH
jgi:hypothetical protein